ncbi:hypothetical protein AB0B78_01130 [Streptomyces sp. NPDC040724]|uniref:hypothetical protein n=1 Tax=Streptomyces sp. NPDC040724 TaxID=3155612 RepID=UPI0033EBBCBA
MRNLILGRPPGPDWRLLPSPHIVVCGEDLLEAAWYEAVPVADLTDLEQILYPLTHAGQLALDGAYCDYEHAMVNASVIASVVGPPQALVTGRDEETARAEAGRAVGIFREHVVVTVAGGVR